MREDAVFTAEKAEKKRRIKALTKKIDRIAGIGDQEELDWQIQALERAESELDEYLKGR